VSERLRGGAFGFALAQGRNAYRVFVRNYEPGDEIITARVRPRAFTAQRSRRIRNAGSPRSCSLKLLLGRMKLLSGE